MARKTPNGFLRKGIRPFGRKGAPAPQLIVPLLSLMVFIGSGLSGGGIFLIRGIKALGVDLSQSVTFSGFLLSIPIFLFALIVVFYATMLAWLVFARLFFTRAQVLTVCCMGMHTALDVWLVNLFFPEKP